MTASETLKLIAKQWCSLSNLMKLAGVGKNNALYIKSTIKKRLENENYYVPNNAVPMQVVAKYLGHTKIEETLKTYSHLFISTLDEIINVIDTLEDKKTDD